MIYLQLRSQQPLCVAAEQAQGTLRRTLEYIPGGTLRGALAARLRAVRPDISQQDFNRLMLAPGSRFQNLYPLPPGRDLARPLPHTARSCKLYPGFIPVRPRPGRPRHGVHDLLFPLLRYMLAGEERGNTLPAQRCHNQECGLPLEPFSGFYSGSRAGDYYQVEVNQRQVTQTAIDPHRETASPANLFTVQAIEEETLFAGYFSLGDPAEEEKFCQTICPAEATLRLGYGRTRGMGLVQITQCYVDSPYLWEDELRERLVKFNEKAEAMNCCIPAGHTLFALALLSDTILLDPFLRPQAGIDGSTLAREVDQTLANSQLLAAFARTRQVYGWSSPHGLPLPADLALTAGSVFVFQTTLSVDALATILAGADVEQVGIGERRAEGFGQVVVCHPFHQEVTAV